MPSASIRLNGATTPKEDYSIGDTVTLTNNDNTGAISWAWTLVSRPTGSSAALTGAATNTATFTIDVEGSYLIKLIVNGSLTDTAVARILTLHKRLKPAARDEVSEADSTEKWAKPWRESMLILDKALGLAEKRTVKYVGSNTTGPKVLEATGVVALANGDIIPTVDIYLPPGSFSGTGTSLFLWETGALNTNDIVDATVRGVTGSIVDATFSALQAAYVKNDGSLINFNPAPDKTVLAGFALEGTNPKKFWFQPSTSSGNSLVGDILIPNALFFSGSRLVAPSAAVSIATDAVTVIDINVGGGSVTMVATPTFTAGFFDGQILLVRNRGPNVFTIQDDGTSFGTNVTLSTPTASLEVGDYIILMWSSDSSAWTEIARSISKKLSTVAISPGDTVNPEKDVVNVQLAADATLGTPSVLASTLPIPGNRDFVQEVLIIVQGDQIHNLTLEDEGTTPGTLLRLSAASLVLTPGSSIRLRYLVETGKWVELYHTILI